MLNQFFFNFSLIFDVHKPKKLSVLMIVKQLYKCNLHFSFKWWKHVLLATVFIYFISLSLDFVKGHKPCLIILTLNYVSLQKGIFIEFISL